MDEFELIRRFFTLGPVQRADVVLGVGDDAALLKVPAGAELAVTTDSLVAGVHFPTELDPSAVGHRSLAANLSDLAAMGAEPAWVLLALTLPEANKTWLEGFSRGFFVLAKQHRLQLVGGNIARGPLNITIIAQGFVPEGQALRRSGARVGDNIFVTGHPGDAAAGLKLMQSGKADIGDPCVRRFAYPEPRVQAGLAMRGLASACVDVSDGLLADLGRILESSKVGATLLTAKLPLSKRLLELQDREAAEQLALTGGDDYELCFTAPAEHQQALEAKLRALECPVACIGSVDAEHGLRCLEGSGHDLKLTELGYKHF
jgi:thiamine-monophosphate kinase